MQKRSSHDNVTDHVTIIINTRLPIVVDCQKVVNNMASVYETCAIEHGDNTPSLIQCISDWVEKTTKDHALSTDASFVASDFAHVSDMTDWLLILTGALVFFMQAGFAMVCAGAIRKKNVKNTVSFTRRNVVTLRS